MKNKSAIIISTFLVSILWLQGCCSLGEKTSNEANNNIYDYVVIFDVSLSMNDPEGDPTLSIAKDALIKLVENNWLPESRDQDTPSRLYFFPFAKDVRAPRQFELTTSGAQEFIDYLSRLEADGYATGIINALEEALERVPKLALADCRTTDVKYLLLTDGDETEVVDIVSRISKISEKFDPSDKSLILKLGDRSIFFRELNDIAENSSLNITVDNVSTTRFAILEVLQEF